MTLSTIFLLSLDCFKPELGTQRAGPTTTFYYLLIASGRREHFRPRSQERPFYCLLIASTMPSSRLVFAASSFYYLLIASEYVWGDDETVYDDTIWLSTIS